MFKKKGQAALEFLTTYGWAFLVVLVMIGALSYFGVMNPSKYVTDSCKLSGLVDCGGGFNVQANTSYVSVGLDLVNNHRNEINVTLIKIKEKQQGTYATLTVNGSDGVIIPAASTGAAQGDPVLNGSFADNFLGKKKVFDVIVMYTLDGSSIESSSGGTITTTVTDLLLLSSGGQQPPDNM